MAPRAGGRHCERCDKTVLDLSKLTRGEAERRLRGIEGPEVCVQLNVDRFGDAVFRVPPARAPHWASGLVLVAALTSGGCSTEPADEPITMEPVPDLGPPMIPETLVSIAPSQPTMVTRPVPSAELDLADAPATPTEEQRRLTANKQRAAIPQVQPMRGGMALHWPNPGL